MSMMDDVIRKFGSNYLCNYRYEIRKILGEGNSGTVCLAEDLLFPSKLVAIKQINLVDLEKSRTIRNTPIPDFVQAEAEKLATLRHHGIPTLDKIWVEGDNYFMAMEYIEGDTLRKYLDSSKGRLAPLETALEFAIQLADVLTYLHDHDPIIVFRDLKPSNIIIEKPKPQKRKTSIKQKRRLKVVDFGAARFYKLNKRNNTEYIVNYGYVAPEVLLGQQADELSDIFSIGAILFEMLTGECRAEVPEPYHFGPVDLRQNVPSSLNSYLMQMLHHDRDKRPLYTRDVLNRLRNEQRKLLNLPPI